MYRNTIYNHKYDRNYEHVWFRIYDISYKRERRIPLLLLISLLLPEEYKERFNSIEIGEIIKKK